MSFIDFLISKLRTPKTSLDKCFRGPANKQHDKRAQALLKFLITALLSYSLITDKSIELENVSLIDMLNLRTDC